MLDGAGFLGHARENTYHIWHCLGEAFRPQVLVEQVRADEPPSGLDRRSLGCATSIEGIADEILRERL